MAVSLARSIRLHGARLPLAVVTDKPNSSALRQAFDVVVPAVSELGHGLRHKLYLDRYTPFQETLFLDADCLAFANLDVAMTAYKGAVFGVGSQPVPCSDRYHLVDNLPALLKCLHLQSIPHINGGLYYFASSSRHIFDAAREFDSGISALRQYMFTGENDEVQFAVALSRLGIEPYCPEPRVISNLTGPVHGLAAINVLTGQSGHMKASEKVSAPVLHFLWGLTKGFTYRRQVVRLRLNRLPSMIREPVAWLAAIPGLRLELRRTRLGRRGRLL
jgi:hypothetical protein